MDEKKILEILKAKIEIAPMDQKLILIEFLQAYESGNRRALDEAYEKVVAYHALAYPGQVEQTIEAIRENSGDEEAEANRALVEKARSGRH